MTGVMRVVCEISRGGFGRVEQVELPSGLMVARKTFDPLPEILRGSNIDKLRARFQREVKIQSFLNGECFLSVLDSDLNSDCPWFTMPLAEKNLWCEISERKDNPAELYPAIAETLNALERLHSYGYVHRDLKPQNILYQGGRWRLSDFGLVMPPVSGTTKLTSVGSAWGTADYCAPEQRLDFRHVTAAADIYAFGAILHDIFGDGPEGRVPYNQHTCAGAIGPIIERCTAQVPEKRFPDIVRLRGALFTILSNHSLERSATTATAADWISKLDRLQALTEEELQSFYRFLAREANDIDIHSLCVELSEERLELISKLDSDLWHIIAEKYCEWAKKSIFSFEYCDVVVSRLHFVYNSGDLGLKSMAAIAAAELGASHNRWNVMAHLLEMCSKAIPDNLAERIAIDVLAESAKDAFIRSAEGINSATGAYHPHIEKVLV